MSYSYSQTSTKSLLKDGSWIRKDEEEDEDVDRDPNFGKSILSRYKTSDTTESVAPAKTSDIKVTTSVQALSKRFSASQDELNKSSTSPTSYGPRSSYKTSSTSLSSPTSTTWSPKSSSSSSSTTVTEDGKTTTTTRSGTFTERVFSDGKTSTKGTTYSSYSPTSTKVMTRTSSIGAEDPFQDALTSDSKTMTVTYGTDGNSYSTRTSSSAEDKLYDSLIPSLKSDPSSVSTTVTRTSLVNVESPKKDAFPSTTTRRSTSTTEDKLYDTLLPSSMTDLSFSGSTTTITRQEVKSVESSDNYRSYNRSYSRPASQEVTVVESPTSDNYSSYTRSYSSSSRPSSASYEYSSITSPTVYTTSSTKYKDSRMNDYLDGDSTYTSKSSIKAVYSAPERTALEKELCSYCHKPFNTEAKMVLDDMNIRCHAACLKCEVCNHTLGNLKAGDSLWVYRRMVHCESCFDVTREKWRH